MNSSAVTHFTRAMQVAVATAAQRGVCGIVADVVAVVPATFALGGSTGVDFHRQSAAFDQGVF